MADEARCEPREKKVVSISAAGGEILDQGKLRREPNSAKMPNFVEPAPIELHDIGVIEFACRGSQSDQNQCRDDAEPDYRESWLVAAHIIQPKPDHELPGQISSQYARSDGEACSEHEQSPADPWADPSCRRQDDTNQAQHRAARQPEQPCPFARLLPREYPAKQRAETDLNHDGERDQRHHGDPIQSIAPAAGEEKDLCV